MRTDDWHLTDDLDEFLARAGDFLRSRPALHNTQLTVLERLRTRRSNACGAETAVFGLLESGGAVRAAFYRLASQRVTLTPLTAEQADTLAARMARLGRPLPLSGVTADHDTATTFAEAWQRHTGAVAVAHWRGRLYRLGKLTPPEPHPGGRARAAGPEDHERVIRWCNEFAADVGEAPALNAGSWSDSRFADKHFTFWEASDGTPLSMAGSTAMVGGMVRVDPVYTPGRLRGHGYAGAVTAWVSRVALAAGATDVVLFTNPANSTSNALYPRIGYVPVADFTGYQFSEDAPGADHPGAEQS